MSNTTDTIDIHSIGTTVSLTESISATIVTISIHANNYVQYECSWWNGDTRVKDWFSSSNFLSVGEKDAVTKIGFIRSKDE